ncbi:MAG TPA: phosphotransferase [Candidatus Polarisedimenticolia bacterium]|nr:phosphotransferase [Candidatus Polarisedimenticolia bacterium]
MSSGPSDPVAAFAARRFGRGARALPLAGDASDRRFYRLKAPGLSPLILMAHREPFELESLPFFQMARYLHGIGAPVPQIVASYPAEGILVVQDLGDETLQTVLGSCDGSRRRFLYLQAVQMIAFLQGEGTRSLAPELPATRTFLDRERLLFELRFFAEHYAGGLLGSPLTSAQQAELDDWFVALATEVGGYRRVLCHRDYHSRNLMVKGDRLYMVDFQDARLGPFTYDLASLARDSYVSLPEDLVAELVEFHREATAAPEGPGAFATAFRRTCLQRNIKAIGTFASQAVLRGNRGYLRYIPRALGSIRAHLAGEADSVPAAVVEMFAGPLDEVPAA